jgi:hypothetical protein
MIFVLSGVVEFEVGTENFELTPGDSIYFDSRVLTNAFPWKQRRVLKNDTDICAGAFNRRPINLRLPRWVMSQYGRAAAAPLFPRQLRIDDRQQK